ncbi:MAG TPA: hypothetical protein VFM35_02305, partial [Candidatus Binatia bacterium]|nr:hypothetical protein [Candidatus Binatia bacterium]
MAVIIAILTGALGYRIGFLPQAAGADPGVQTCDPADATPSVWRCLYVATNGSDQNPGTLNAPLATIDAAKARARTFSVDWRGDVLIVIRGGTYYLRHTIVFEPADSGKNGHRLIVRPFGGEAVRISGGQRVRTWSGPIDGGIYWSTDLPKVTFRHLTVNGRRAPRARHPNGSDFHTIAAWDKPGDAIKCPEKSGRRLGVFDQDAWFVDSLSRETLSQVEVFLERYHGSAIVRIASVG